MKKKPSPIAILIRTDAELESQLAEYVRTGCEVTAARASLDIKLAEIREKLEPAILEKEEARKTAESSIALYCEKHKARFIGDSRSIEFPTARVGFRTNPPKVDKVRTKDTFENIAERLEQTDWGKEFVKEERPTVNKASLLSKRADLTEAQLKEVGLEIIQDETFYIEPKLESSAGAAIEQAA